MCSVLFTLHDTPILLRARGLAPAVPVCKVHACIVFLRGRGHRCVQWPPRLFSFTFRKFIFIYKNALLYCDFEKFHVLKLYMVNSSKQGNSRSTGAPVPVNGVWRQQCVALCLCRNTMQPLYGSSTQSVPLELNIGFLVFSVFIDSYGMAAPRPRSPQCHLSLLSSQGRRCWLSHPASPSMKRACI